MGPTLASGVKEVTPEGHWTAVKWRTVGLVPTVVHKKRGPYEKQLRHLRLGIIGALSAAYVLATATAAEAVELTTPVTTLRPALYQGLMNFQEQPGDPTSGVKVFFGIRYGQAPGRRSCVGNRPRRPILARDRSSRIASATPVRRDRKPIPRIACSSTSMLRPPPGRGSKLPVWIWIHGGALLEVSAAPGLTTTRR